MFQQKHTRRASGSGALLVLCFLLFTCQSMMACAEPQNLPQGCQPARFEEQAQVSYIYDGDTVRLDDGRRVRLIGINTPEIGHDDSASQPYAEAARASLHELLDAGGNSIYLQFGKERKDHYGRLLAHAYLGNGKNVAAMLLRQGYATTLVVPPNTAAADCYQQIEQEARSAGRGLWKLAAYQTQDAVSLAADAHGFHIVRGRVTGIEKSRYQVRIELDGLLSARISHKDLVNFEPGYLEKLVGQKVELRGWIKPGKGGPGVRIRHPAALVPVYEPAGL